MTHHHQSYSYLPPRRDTCQYCGEALPGNRYRNCKECAALRKIAADENIYGVFMQAVAQLQAEGLEKADLRRQLTNVIETRGEQDAAIMYGVALTEADLAPYENWLSAALENAEDALAALEQDTNGEVVRCPYVHPNNLGVARLGAADRALTFWQNNEEASLLIGRLFSLPFLEYYKHIWLLLNEDDIYRAVPEPLADQISQCLSYGVLPGEGL